MSETEVVLCKECTGKAKSKHNPQKVEDVIPLTAIICRGCENIIGYHVLIKWRDVEAGPEARNVEKYYFDRMREVMGVKTKP